MASIKIKFSQGAAGYWTVDAPLPALSGSDKQIKWATELRSDFIGRIADQIAKAAKVTLGVVLESETQAIAALEAEVAARIAADKHGPAMMERLDKAISQTSAAYWIDNRGTQPMQMLREAL